MLLATADLHLNSLARDKYRHDFQKHLRELVKKHKVTVTTIVGDLTDDKDYHPAVLVNQIVDHIWELSKLCVVIIDLGNHDYASLVTTPFFAFLSRLENVFWVSTPTIGRNIPNLPPTASNIVGNTLFLPHSPNPERDWKKLSFKGFDRIFAHNTFEGTRGDGGRLLKGPSPSVFPKGAEVWCGDVHTPQVVGAVEYLGAPYTVDFGDDYEPRVMLFGKNKNRSIDVGHLPQKRLLEAVGGKPLPKHTTLAEGDILKVKVELTHAQYTSHWAEFKQDVLEWGHRHKLVIHQVLPVVNKDKAKVAKTKVTATSDPEVVKSFSKRHKLDDATIKVGLDLL